MAKLTKIQVKRASSCDKALFAILGKYGIVYGGCSMLRHRVQSSEEKLLYLDNAALLHRDGHAVLDIVEKLLTE